MRYHFLIFLQVNLCDLLGRNDLGDVCHISNIGDLTVLSV